MVGYWQKISGK